MRKYFYLFLMEQKRAVKVLPAVFGEGFLLLLFLLLAFLAVRAVTGEEILLQKIPIGIVAEGQEEMTEMVLSYLEHMAGIGEVCEFLPMDKEEGIQALKKGKIAGLAVLPEFLIDSVLDGRNLPVTLYLPEEFSFASAFLKDLAHAGMQMLSGAQAEVYALHDLAQETGQEALLPQLEQEMNLYNLHFAVNAEQMMKEQKVEVTGAMSPAKHYLSAAIVLVMLLTGTACGRFLKGDGETLTRQLYRTGIGAGAWVLTKILAVCTVTGAIAGFLCIMVKLAGWNIPLSLSPAAFLSAVFCAAALLVLCYEAVRGRAAGAFLVMGMTVLMMFFAGGFVPDLFLPEVCRKMGRMLPVKAMILGNTAQLLCWGAGCCAITVLAAKGKERRL